MLTNTNAAAVDPTSSTARALRLAQPRQVLTMSGLVTRLEASNDSASLNGDGLFERVDGRWLLTENGEAARAELLT
jgi:hypothetical protein